MIEAKYKKYMLSLNKDLVENKVKPKLQKAGAKLSSKVNVLLDQWNNDENLTEEPAIHRKIDIKKLMSAREKRKVKMTVSIDERLCISLKNYQQINELDNFSQMINAILWDWMEKSK